MNRDVTSMGSGNRSRITEPQATATLVATRIHLIIAIKHIADGLLGNSFTTVAQCNADPIAQGLHIKLDKAAVLCEFHGIVQQIRQESLHAVCIKVQLTTWRQPPFKPYVFQLCDGFEKVTDIIDKFIEIHKVRMRNERSRIQLPLHPVTD